MGFSQYLSIGDRSGSKSRHISPFRTVDVHDHGTLFSLYLRVAQDASRERRAFSAGGLDQLWPSELRYLLRRFFSYSGNGDGTHAGMTIGEIIYRCFMSFYGLVFPAYVWLCRFRRRMGIAGLGGAGAVEAGGAGVGVCGGRLVIGWGLLERAEWWLAPGLGWCWWRLLVRKKALGTGH